MRYMLWIEIAPSGGMKEERRRSRGRYGRGRFNYVAQDLMADDSVIVKFGAVGQLP